MVRRRLPGRALMESPPVSREALEDSASGFPGRPSSTCATSPTARGIADTTIFRHYEGKSNYQGRATESDQKPRHSARGRKGILRTILTLVLGQRLFGKTRTQICPSWRSSRSLVAGPDGAQSRGSISTWELFPSRGWGTTVPPRQFERWCAGARRVPQSVEGPDEEDDIQASRPKTRRRGKEEQGSAR